MRQDSPAHLIHPPLCTIWWVSQLASQLAQAGRVIEASLGAVAEVYTPAPAC
jgi:hypothetical protein